jgi:uncharacterized damage-inducible protein DinB
LNNQPVDKERYHSSSFPLDRKDRTLISSLLHVNEFNLSMLKRLMADWPEDKLDWQPAEGLHSARWLLVHLAIAVDYGLMQFGEALTCPAEWHQAYGPGSSAGSNELKPTIEELMSAIDQGYGRLRNLMSGMDEPGLEERHQVGLLADTPLITKGDLVAHIAATHFASHLGQLSTLRRLLGKPPLF